MPRRMRKDYLPMALGFWGIALPLAVFGLVFCRTAAERLTAFLAAAVFALVGVLISRAKR
ncbi:MAG TPA: hypothetical protein VMS75_07970 [Terriglobales bacterium]|nr:hypothetical protein [Terriglobales bacterium]